MADYSRATPTGWEQWDDTADRSRATPTGWLEITGAAAASGEVASTPAQDLSYGFGPARAARLNGVLQ